MLEQIWQYIKEKWEAFEETFPDYYLFFNSIAKGDYAQVEKMLDRIDLETTLYVKKQTPLISAASWNQKAIVELFLINGAQLETKNKEGRNALLAAAEKGHHEIVELLLQYGANKEATTKSGYNPLLLAAQLGYSETVRILLHFGANIHAQNKLGYTALHMASWFAHENTVKLLLENGARAIIEVQDKDGDTPLILAAREGLTDTTNHISTVNIIKLLLEYGANREATNNSGRTALSFAQEKGNISVVHLLKNFEKVTIQDKLKDYSCEIPFHLKCPISHEIMDYPVTVSSGITYDLSSLCLLFDGKKVVNCPVTRKPLLVAELTHCVNITIKQLIDEFVEQIQYSNRQDRKSSRKESEIHCFYQPKKVDVNGSPNEQENPQDTAFSAANYPPP